MNKHPQINHFITAERSYQTDYEKLGQGRIACQSFSMLQIFFNQKEI